MFIWMSWKFARFHEILNQRDSSYFSQKMSTWRPNLTHLHVFFSNFRFPLIIKQMETGWLCFWYIVDFYFAFDKNISTGWLHQSISWYMMINTSIHMNVLFPEIKITIAILIVGNFLWHVTKREGFLTQKLKLLK